MVAQEKTGLVDARLGPQSRLLRSAVLGGVELAVKVEVVGVLAAGPLGGAGQGREDKALQRGDLGGGVDGCNELGGLVLCGPLVELLALLRLVLVGRVGVALPEVGDNEDGVGVLEGRAQGGGLVQVGLDDLDAAGLQRLGVGTRGAAGDGADVPVGVWVLEDGVDDGAALLASGAEDDEELGGGRHCWLCYDDDANAD